MLKERASPSSEQEQSGSTRISHVKIYKTPAGPLFVRNCCSPSFVEGLKADQGLRAFAQQPANRLTLAYTATGKIVGQATLAPIDDWWQDIGNAYKIAVYEGLGISGFDYRALISRLFAAHGFTEYLTSEPNIRMDPANILVAHLGRHLEEETINRFFQRLLKSETLPGL